jgi:hypothetical protein
MTDDEHKEGMEIAKYLSDGNMQHEAGIAKAIAFCERLAGKDRLGEMAAMSSRLKRGLHFARANHELLNEVGAELLQIPYPQPTSR